MVSFIPGQRWISDTEPELGLGTILDVRAHRVTVTFLASGQQRTYASDNAPLTRVRFSPGDKVQDVDGHQLKISAADEHDGLLIYSGIDEDGILQTVEEIELDHFLQFNKPQDRLFAGQIDSIALFQLRIKTLRARADLEQSPVRGLIGPRTSLISHQLFIATEVALRHDPRVMLADEVGLGKTIEAGLILHHRLLTGRAERVLLIVPESLLHQWLVEMRRRFNLRFSIFDEERYCQAEDTNPFFGEQLVLCSQEFFLANPKRQTDAIAAGWDLCAVDEAHHLRQIPGKASPEYAFVEQLARSVPGLLLLTATPEQSGKADHFARLRLLDPDRFHDLESFLAEERNYQALASVIDHLLDQPLACPELLRQLKDFLDQDRADDLLAQIGDPDRYPAARTSLIQLLLDRHGTGRILFRNTRMTVKGFPGRRLTTHALSLPLPYRELLATHGLGPEAHLHPETLSPDAGPSVSEWWRWDPRVDWLTAFLKNLYPAKALVICAKAKTAQQLEQALRLGVGVRCAAFHEGLTIVARDRAAAWFADDEDGAQVLICSEIGSEGRNFQFTHHLVLFDLPLNPDLLEQRIGRLDRIGQTATVNIHLPYFQDGGQASLVRWYIEALDAFHHPCPVAQSVFTQVSTDLAEAIVRPNEDHVQAMIARSLALQAELTEALHRGRDRLLELSSCQPAIAARLMSEIAARDQDPDLWPYLEEVFDYFGVNVEDHSTGCFILTPSEHLRIPHFPELPDDGMTVTVDRTIALAREDMAFLTWEHPLVRGAMDLILSSGYGNAAFMLAQHREIPAGQLFVEAIHIVESPAPKQLQIGRFLPPTLIETLVDARGLEIPAGDCKAFTESHGAVSAEAMTAFLRGQQRLIETLIKRADQIARSRLRILLGHSQQNMLSVMTEELKRLAALRRVNPSVRQQEIDQLKQEGLELHHCIQSAQLRLDALRIILTV